MVQSTQTSANVVCVSIARLPHGKGMSLPDYQSESAAGMDLHAGVPEDEPVAVMPGAIVLIPTGFAIALPVGYEAQIRPRSGLAVKHGITLINSPGTIDADYRGEIKVPIVNHASEVFNITRHMRIAQMIIKPVPRTVWQEVADLDATGRGEGGFGHTGH